MVRREAFLRTVAIGLMVAVWLAALVLPPVLLLRARRLVKCLKKLVAV